MTAKGLAMPRGNEPRPTRLADTTTRSRRTQFQIAFHKMRHDAEIESAIRTNAEWSLPTRLHPRCHLGVFGDYAGCRFQCHLRPKGARIMTYNEEREGQRGRVKHGSFERRLLRRDCRRGSWSRGLKALPAGSARAHRHDAGGHECDRRRDHA